MKNKVLRILSLYQASVRHGSGYITALIMYPMFKLMSQMSPSFRQNLDVYDFKSYLQNYRRRNSDDNDVWIDRASMIIPCVSLFALILIVLSSLNVPVRGVHVAIILALIIAMAVYVWKQLDLKIAEQYKREFKQMASQRRRKWVLCSCLCLLLTALLPFMLMLVA